MGFPEDGAGMLEDLCAEDGGGCGEGEGVVISIVDIFVGEKKIGGVEVYYDGTLRFFGGVFLREGF